jgi:hypothetical protein
VPYAVGKELSESPLVTACEPGLFEGYAQSWVIKREAMSRVLETAPRRRDRHHYDRHDYRDNQLTEGGE